jgi:hypothetical protein
LAPGPRLFGRTGRNTERAGWGAAEGRINLLQAAQRGARNLCDISRENDRVQDGPTEHPCRLEIIPSAAILLLAALEVVADLGEWDRAARNGFALARTTALGHPCPPKSNSNAVRL